MSGGSNLVQEMVNEMGPNNPALLSGMMPGPQQMGGVPMGNVAPVYNPNFIPNGPMMPPRPGAVRL